MADQREAAAIKMKEPDRSVGLVLSREILKDFHLT